MTHALKTQLLYWTLAILLLNTAYLAAFASPTVFYFANVVLHMVLGVALAAFLAVQVVRRRFQPPRAHRTVVRAVIVLAGDRARRRHGLRPLDHVRRARRDGGAGSSPSTSG